MKLSVGDKIQFTLGETPMVGTVLFAFGTDACGVRLTSGAEILIDLSTIKGKITKVS